MKPTVIASFTIFAVLSALSVALSGAPAKVHVVNIGCFFLAFVAGTVLAERRVGNRRHYVIWMLSSAVGLLLWDILSSFVVVKAKIFMGWHVLYPLGLVGLVALQLLALTTSKLQPFTKFRQGTQ